MSTVNVNRVVDASGGVLAPISSVMRNRIINGQMVLDQRNAGASVTPTNGSYTLDRWQIGASQASKFTVQQNAGSVTPPVGFTNYFAKEYPKFLMRKNINMRLLSLSAAGLKIKKKYGRQYLTTSLNMLRFPSFQSVAILPVEIKSKYNPTPNLFGSAYGKDFPYEIHFILIGDYK
jgi:hypothetical protein